MKFVGLAFVFIAFGILKGMILGTLGVSTIIDIPTAPTFSLNETEMDELFDFETVGGYDAISEATANVGIAIADTGKVVLAVIKYIFGLIVFITLLFAYVVLNAISGIEGAPFYVSILVATPGLLMVGLIIYKLLRSGDDDA